MEQGVTEKSVCMGMRCGLVFDGLEKTCPECGKFALPQASIRRRGWFIMVCGVLLLGIMGTVLWFIVPVLLAPNHELNGSSFDGTPEQMQFMLAIFAMVIAIGLAALVTGYTQAIHGRRQKGAVWVMMVFAGVLVAFGYMVRRGFIS